MSGTPEALVILSEIHRWGMFGKIMNKEKSFESYLKIVNMQGGIHADLFNELNNHIGICYHLGIGTGKDDKLALKYWSRTSIGDELCTFNRSLALKYGWGISIDNNKAKELLDKCDVFSSKSYHELGMLYFDYEEYQVAFDIFTIGKMHNVSKCILMLAKCNYLGLGCKLDLLIETQRYDEVIKESQEYKGTLVTFPYAKLALMYLNGLHFKKNNVVAARLTLKAIDTLEGKIIRWYCVSQGIGCHKGPKEVINLLTQIKQAELPPLETIKLQYRHDICCVICCYPKLKLKSFYLVPLITLTNVNVRLIYKIKTATNPNGILAFLRTK